MVNEYTNNSVLTAGSAALLVQWIKWLRASDFSSHVLPSIKLRNGHECCDIAIKSKYCIPAIYHDIPEVHGTLNTSSFQSTFKPDIQKYNMNLRNTNLQSFY